MEEDDPSKRQQPKPTHHYEHIFEICKTKDGYCTLPNVFEAVRRRPAPGATGTKPVETGSTTEVPYLGRVTHEVDRDRMTVTNKTESTHMLHPGQVQHTVREREGRIEVVTTGDGSGMLGRWNSALSGLLWSQNMDKVKDDLTKKKEG